MRSTWPSQICQAARGEDLTNDHDEAEPCGAFVGDCPHVLHGRGESSAPGTRDPVWPAALVAIYRLDQAALFQTGYGSVKGAGAERHTRERLDILRQRVPVLRSRREARQDENGGLVRPFESLGGLRDSTWHISSVLRPT